MAISLYEELNSYLKNSEYWYEEYWYEEGSGKVSEILSKFTQEDWNNLIKEIFNKSVDYQEKIAYCMNDIDNKNELEFLIYMTKNAKDSIVFENCLDSLIEFVTPETKFRFLSDDQLIILITGGIRKETIEGNGRNKIYKTIYEQFFEKLNNK
ncbi:Uncharacterised protein [Sebaldella termitidis]|uniref:Uncharacterized protein n=1 Tax=Sebaldella termitidis (strain ATCC 33386 / NCTC 11300) TaxID=526218 RepID=D1AMS4_SEBTE|nr:hypothetical protein [Sebaldella termitidis]ACZ07300.1 hypothetical protein Sterm_0418 [Sebaldella termitidis ATCC 33386]SUI22593.1 Uncharacterised protein [Sebaldella termitidis]